MDSDADADDLGVDLLLIDQLGPAQALLQLRDPLLDDRLLVLGIVELGVL